MEQEPISSDRLKAFIDKAKKKGIRIGNYPDSTGNFELYCGDPDVLDEVLDHLEESMQAAKKAGLMKPDADIILQYDNVLGYKKNRSVIDIGAFAETKGKTITLNKFMFDDTSFLKDQYEDAEEHGKFAKGTDYRNIVDHEIGHIVDRKNKKFRRRILHVLQKEASNANMTLDEYLIQNISEYSTSKRRNDLYYELIPELTAMSKGRLNSVAFDIFSKVGVVL